MIRKEVSAVEHTPDWRKVDIMLIGFPKAIPEIPVRDVERAAEYYVDVLGFTFDWGDDQGGIGGISQGKCRMFLTNSQLRGQYETTGAVII